MMKAHNMDRENFEEWIAAMDLFLEELQVLVPEFADDLDFSAPSLSKLEGHLLARCSSIEAMLSAENKSLLNASAVYVGETIRKQLDGRWDIDLKNEKSVYYKLPVITTSKGELECPLSLVTASMDRRKGNYMEGVLKYFIEEHFG